MLINLEKLSTCVQQHAPDYYKSRLFPAYAQKQSKEKGYISGNNCTYVNGYLHELYPEFVHYIRHISTIAAQALPNPLDCMQLGIRGMEYIQYEAGNKLELHRDKESVYTIVIMLSDPRTDFTGGNFLIEDSVNWYGDPATRLLEVNMSANGGVFFYSEYRHGIQLITGGQRRIFTVEFWNHPDSRAVNERPWVDEPRLLHTPTAALYKSGPPPGPAPPRGHSEVGVEVDGVTLSLDGTTVETGGGSGGGGGMDVYAALTPAAEECEALLGAELYRTVSRVSPDPGDPSHARVHLTVQLPYLPGRLYCAAFPERLRVNIERDHILCMQQYVDIVPLEIDPLDSVSLGSQRNVSLALHPIRGSQRYTLHCLTVSGDAYSEVTDVLHLTGIGIGVDSSPPTARSHEGGGERVPRPRPMPSPVTLDAAAASYSLYSAESHQLWAVETQGWGDQGVMVWAVPISKRETGVGATSRGKYSFFTPVSIQQREYIVKQKSRPWEQIKVVGEALAGYIARDLGIAHAVEVISLHTYIPGKVEYRWPCLLLSRVPGTPLRELRVGVLNSTLDIEQGYAKPEERQGLQRETIRQSTLHPQLPVIIALDLMIGNRDRHRGTLLYDNVSNSFCVIDMDDSFEVDLTLVAVENLCKMTVTGPEFDAGERLSLGIMLSTVRQLLARHRSNELIYMLDYYLMKSGMGKGTPAHTPEVETRVGEYAAVIADTWVNARKLVSVLEYIVHGNRYEEYSDVCTPFTW